MIKKIGEMKSHTTPYKNLHAWVRRHKPKSIMCEMCRDNPAVELANISDEYKKDIDDYLWLCTSCHHKFDIKPNCIICGKKHHAKGLCKEHYQKKQNKIYYWKNKTKEHERYMVRRKS